MLKGLLSGVIWGAIISVFIVVGASLNAPLPGPRTGTVDIPVSGAFGTLAPETPLVVPATEPEPDLPDPNRTQLEDPAPLDTTEVAPEGVVPENEAPVPDTIEPESAETPVEPETPEASDPINTEPPETEQVATDATEAVTPEAETPATATPDTEAPETEAPETQEPETRAPDVSDAFDPDDEDIIEPELNEDPVDTEPVDTDIEAPTLDEIPETSAEAEASDASEEPAQETPVEVPTEITEPTTEEQLDEAPDAAPVEATPTEDTQPQDAPEIAPQSPTLNSAIGFGGGALRRNALDIPVDTSLPLFSIIVIDRSGSGLPLSEVAAYPAPLTVALDPTQPGAIEASEGYAASGHEVLILANSLPSDAAPLAAAAALTQLLNQMPTAVGVLLPPGSPFVRDATRASELTAILAQSGHGLVSLPQGLDALGRAAAVADVPDAEVFRVLDSQDEGVPLMMRYMDRAAFQAARDGSVVVLGIVQQKTMEALNQWFEGRRAATVAVAPISKVMLQE